MFGAIRPNPPAFLNSYRLPPAPHSVPRQHTHRAHPTFTDRVTVPSPNQPPNHPTRPTMTQTNSNSHALAARLARLLRLPDVEAATAFAHAYPHHHALVTPVPSSGLLPLHYACLLGDPTLVCAMLHGGATVDVHSLKLAACGAHVDAMTQLLRHAPPTVISSSGEAVFEAAYRGSIQCVNMLVAAGAPTNFRGCDGSTPLHMAALSGSIAMVDCLLSAGANPSMVDAQGCTAATCARRVGYLPVVGRLWAAVTEMQDQRALEMFEHKGKPTTRVSKIKQEEGCVVSSGDGTAGISPTLSDDGMEMEEMERWGEEDKHSSGVQCGR